MSPCLYTVCKCNKLVSLMLLLLLLLLYSNVGDVTLYQRYIMQLVSAGQQHTNGTANIKAKYPKLIIQNEKLYVKSQCSRIRITFHCIWNELLYLVQSITN